MRFLVISFSAGLLSLASCSEPARMAASRSEDGAESVVQPDHQAALNSGSTDHHITGAETPHHADEHSQTKHTHGGQHGTHNHQHSSDSHAHGGASDNTKKTMIGGKVPDFEVTINGKLWKLSELRKNAELTKDGTLVLTFWCSFCHSCRHVEHQLDDLARKYKNRVGVIALDASAGETTETVAKFAEKHGLTLPIALNANGAAADIFGVRATTTTVVIDSHGILRYRGQFVDSQHKFAEDALSAVLSGDDVPQKETTQKG
jgi:thiol-disulfide isomerase/thioredoxin